MRARHFLRLLVPFALALPLAAHAEWPADSRDTYMEECLATASQNVDNSQAQKHCECGADVIEKNFSSEEIAALNNRQTPPPAALRERLVQSVATCNQN